MRQVLFAAFVVALAVVLGCDMHENSKVRVKTAVVWQQPQPAHAPELSILVRDKEPLKGKVTVLTGNVPREQWPLVPWSLKRLCPLIPDLPDRTILIYRHASEYGDGRGTEPLAVYSSEGYDIAFIDMSAKDGNIFPLRIPLGSRWCANR